ncbi:protein-tyrosine phosphatase family protein [Arthrobacter sp. PsM3]|uniref:protein-tyrosine phosphatase family protein n=1 Tax=Arthrobacter sp. PsM3 TaxID=3030531 RepID=UPI00263A87B8|nr:protein-tyrosine phosphatase family protein [Arthrobacter sp. PsM3]MDN4643818.1 protein-tyrosine phosphatase family protein [Arthrobacter sp. PsM3]
MRQTWDPGRAGILELPSGLLIRGRALLRPIPAGPQPEFGLYLLGKRPAAVGWDSRWVRWRDLRVPADDADTLDALTEALRRAETERVEVACWGGRGRTGTALACLAILDGVPPAEAVAFVRARYRRGAVETPWQRTYVARFRVPEA